MSADAWGIEDGYIDTRGAWRATTREARSRLQSAMGATGLAPDAAGPVSLFCALTTAGVRGHNHPAPWSCAPEAPDAPTP